MNMAKLLKIRLDHLLVQKGLVENASKARAHIMAGDVVVNDHCIDKAGEKFAPDVEIRLRRNSHPFVSRGGVKLEHAIKSWPSDILGAICLDVGASTGGFSEVLLNHGASLVYAVDVGYGQLAHSLRIDQRIINLERTHILNLKAEDLPKRPSIAVIDVSFISVLKILPHVSSLLDDQAFIYVLIKPQFEAGREHVEKGGIVKDEEARMAAVDKVARLVVSLNFIVRGLAPSPILGAKGNVEYLLAAQRLTQPLEHFAKHGQL
jgi:23S rRNA (cytidine1920-2'-O)/16S rRNA (cytidine1409-2'-O)-methyltransferase